MDIKEARLVKNIARQVFNRYCPKGDSGSFTMEDLLHYGIIGLLKAKNNYKKDMNVPFLGYAAIRIRGEVMDAVRKSPLVKIPQEKRKQYNILARARNALLNQGKIPNTRDLARYLGWDEDSVIRVETHTAPVTSLDHRPVYKDIAGEIPDGNAEKNVLASDLSKIIQYCLEALGDTTQRLILIARELKEMKLRQVAEQFGWSIEKVRQHQIHAKEKMKKCLEKHGWDLT